MTAVMTWPVRSDGVKAEPTPTLTSINISTTAAGTTNLTVTFTGSEFFADSTVYCNGVAIATTPVSYTSLTAVIPTASMAAAGTLLLVVKNGNRTSISKVFSVTLTPTVTGVTNNSATAGAGNTPITIGGVGFSNPSVVRFGGTALSPVTFTSSTSLIATIPSALLVSAGSFAITVDGAAGSATFTVQVSPTAFDDSSLAPTGYETLCHLPSLPVFNAITYGAVGDGVADDTVAVRAALAAAVAANGGIIYLPGSNSLSNSGRAGVYAFAPQIGDTGQQGPYAVTISGTTITGTSATTNFGNWGAGTTKTVIFSNVGTLPQITNGVFVGTGPGNWYFAGNFNQTNHTFSIFTTYSDALANTNPISFYDGGSGVQMLSPQQFSIFTIASSNIVFIGDHDPTTSLPTTTIKGYVIGKLDPATNWIVTGDGYGKIGRYNLFAIGTSVDMSVTQFRSLSIDGQAGYTPSFTGPPSVGGDRATGLGWDLHHKQFFMGQIGPVHIDNVLFFNTDIKNCRGEGIYSASQLMLNCAIVGATNRHCVIKGCNASMIAVMGGWTYKNLDVGGPTASTDSVLNGYEIEMRVQNGGVGNGLTMTWEDCTVTNANGTGILAGCEIGRTFTFTRTTLNTCHVGIAWNDSVGAANLTNVVFINCVNGVQETHGNASPALSGGLNNISFTSCSIDNGMFFLLVGANVKNLAFSGCSVLGTGSLMSGNFGQTLADWGVFTVDGTTIASGATDIHIDGNPGVLAGIWTNTTRANSKTSCGVKIDMFSGTGPFTIHPLTDQTWLNAVPGGSGTYLYQIDPATLQYYPDGYTTKFVTSAGATYKLKADATWNDFSGDITITDGVTKIKYQTSTGKFTQLA